MSILNDRLEEAFASVLTATIAALGPVFDGQLAEISTGKAATDKDRLPIVICAAEGGEHEETPIGTGNFWVEFAISIRHRANPDPTGQDPTDDPKASDQALVGAIRDALRSDSLQTQLNAAVADFYVFQGSLQWKTDTSAQDPLGTWVTTFQGRCYCCAVALA